MHPAESLHKNAFFNDSIEEGVLLLFGLNLYHMNNILE